MQETIENDDQSQKICQLIKSLPSYAQILPAWPEREEVIFVELGVKIANVFTQTDIVGYIGLSGNRAVSRQNVSIIFVPPELKSDPCNVWVLFRIFR